MRATRFMDPLIQRLDTELRRLRPAYHAELKPGATDADFAAFEAEFGFALPAELRQWFSWRNGQRGYASLVDNHCLQSLGEMADTMRVNRELLAAGEFGLNWWRPAWLPFLANGGGDNLCLDPEGTFTGEPGQLVQHWHDWERRTVAFPDFSSWLTAVVTRLEQAAAATGDDLSDDRAAELEPASPPGYPRHFAAQESTS